PAERAVMGVGRWAFGVGCWVLLAGAGCARLKPGPPTPNAERPTPIRLADVTAAAGLRFRHVSGASGRFYFPETLGSGCAFFDYDRDGHPDIFLVNSTYLPGAPRSGTPTKALYHNRGDGTFEDVTKKAGLAVEM